jgi:hypothetical protein
VGNNTQEKLQLIDCRSFYPPDIDSITNAHGYKVSQKCKVNVAQMKYASPIIIAAYYKAANSPKNLNAE